MIGTQVIPVDGQNHIQCLQLTVQGAVQGVGFRPFVYRLAQELALCGWVNNNPQGVFIEVEGQPARLEAFAARLVTEKPAPAIIQHLETNLASVQGHSTFTIRASRGEGAKTAIILPDLATCPDCLQEMLSAEDRRYHYPFINCTNCGPRFSIIEALPYDRPHTTMKIFPMCAECQAEYDDPGDRRFHAQPNACPVCGPQLALWAADGALGSDSDEPLPAAAAALKNGKIVAVKGLGGFHLMAAAHLETAVTKLRRRKRRPAKPLALMAPSLHQIKSFCRVSEQEEELLLSTAAPIVLLQRQTAPDGDYVPVELVAPDNPTLGVMLPANPIHHLLLAELGFPLVATSGNLSDEPICIDENEAVARLGHIADLFLVHNRPIARHVDDSLVRVDLDQTTILRRARGYAPLPVMLPVETTSILAVGAHLKNSAVLAVGQQAYTSQHIGDLETTAAYQALQRVTTDFERLYESSPERVACDLHPDYLSTRLAEERRRPLLRVQHHQAHVLACMAENNVKGPLLGVAWDGTGYGPDGTIWGGEFLFVNGPNYSRRAHLCQFPLPGGDQAIREPRRAALGLLYAQFGPEIFQWDWLPSLQAFTLEELAVLERMLSQALNCPQTSSAGRLFDAVSSLTGLRQISQFEGQAAMAVEFAQDRKPGLDPYPFSLLEGDDGLILDWGPLLQALLADVRAQVTAGIMAARFQQSCVAMITAVARRLGESRIILSGGCFQNQTLLTETVRALREDGCEVFWHHQVPPNDGGIALGQVLAAALAEE